jgi:AraC family transcriptional regulator, arabinose operon regulatory protein
MNSTAADTTPLPVPPVPPSATRISYTPQPRPSKADEILRIIAAKEEIERNIAAPLYVSHFASVAGLRPATFSRRFARFVGVTPIRYRLELRIAHARRLLLEQPTQTIATIAKAVGFEDVRFFHRAFRSVSGVTPLAYRRMHRGDGGSSAALQAQ